MNKDLLGSLRSKKGMHPRWKQGHRAWEEQRDVLWVCRDGIRKGKALTGPSLVRDAKSNRKGLCRSEKKEKKEKKGRWEGWREAEP